MQGTQGHFSICAAEAPGLIGVLWEGYVKRVFVVIAVAVVKLWLGVSTAFRDMYLKK